MSLSTPFYADRDPPVVIGLDKNSAMPLANSKTITDVVTLLLPHTYIFTPDFF